MAIMITIAIRVTVATMATMVTLVTIITTCTMVTMVTMISKLVVTIVQRITSVTMNPLSTFVLDDFTSWFNMILSLASDVKRVLYSFTD